MSTKEEEREFWEQAKDAQEEVASWPAWKRGAAARARVTPEEAGAEDRTNPPPGWDWLVYADGTRSKTHVVGVGLRTLAGAWECFDEYTASLRAQLATVTRERDDWRRSSEQAAYRATKAEHEQDASNANALRLMRGTRGP